MTIAWIPPNGYLPAPSKGCQMVPQGCQFTIPWIVLACRMARGTDQVFIHILLRAVAQTSIGERDFRYFRFHCWGPKKKPTHPFPIKKGDSIDLFCIFLALSFSLQQDTYSFQYFEIPFSILSLEVTMSDIRSMLSSSQSRKDLHGGTWVRVRCRQDLMN